VEEAGYYDFHVRMLVMDNRDFGLLLGNFVGWDGKHGVGLDCWINTPVDIACEPSMDGGGCRYEVHDF